MLEISQVEGGIVLDLLQNVSQQFEFKHNYYSRSGTTFPQIEHDCMHTSTPPSPA